MIRSHACRRWHGALRPLLLAFSLCALSHLSTAAFAVIERHEISHELQADGSVLEHERLVVRIASRDDAEDWTAYPIYLDEHRELLEVDAFFTPPNGKREVVKRKRQDRIAGLDSSITHASSHYHVIDFPALEVGTILEITYTVASRPYYPAAVVPLSLTEDTLHLDVRVAGMPEHWRWWSSEQGDGLAFEETPGGLRVRGEGLPAPDPPAYAPGELRKGAVLHYTWPEPRNGASPEGATSWQAVGAWYGDLLAQLQDDDSTSGSAVRAQARELLAESMTPREKLERLVQFVRKEVRYVAVEVGIGGFKPSLAHETLERRWGDCKDKAFLLEQLLIAADIDASLALILLSDDAQIPADFPSPLHFNHAILAVDASAVETVPGDPVRDGWLFIDATQERGGVSYLHPAVQNQHALVVEAPGGARLVTTPTLPDPEHRALAVELRVEENGNGVGTSHLQVSGRQGSALMDAFARTDPTGRSSLVASVLSASLPRVELGAQWVETAEDTVPSVTMTADVAIRALARGRAQRYSITLPWEPMTPDPAILQERGVPIVLSSGSVAERWTLALPDGWCPPSPHEVRLENAIGRVAQTITVDGGVVTVTRELTLLERRVEPEAFKALAELARSERAEGARRLRMHCER